MAMIRAAKNGPKTWAYGKVGDKHVSVWNANGRPHSSSEQVSAAQFEDLYKQKTLNSSGYTPIDEAELRQRMPSLGEDFFA